MNSLVADAVAKLSQRYAECEDVAIELVERNSHLELVCRFRARTDGITRVHHLRVGRQGDPTDPDQALLASIEAFEKIMRSVVRPRSRW